MNKYLICYRSWRNDTLQVFYTQAETMKQAIGHFRDYFTLDDIMAISVLDDDIELSDIDM